MLHQAKNEQQEDEEMKEADSIPSQQTTSSPPEAELSQQQEPDNHKNYGESKGVGHKKMVFSAESIDADEDGAAVIEDVMDTDEQQS